MGKNLLILPTDKPSRLFTASESGKLCWTRSYFNQVGLLNRNHHLYITCDEEIKVNDYITDGYAVWKWKDDSSLLGRRKVILTTDRELIADGVQAIDDNFLEWIIKNPSCEVVEVKSFVNGNVERIYEAIVPKEETKLETLEEFISKEGFHDRESNEIWELGVKQCSNWQAEQILNFITNEDNHTEGELGNSCIDVQTLIKFIIKLKKKA